MRVRGWGGGALMETAEAATLPSQHGCRLWAASCTLAQGRAKQNSCVSPFTRPWLLGWVGRPLSWDQGGRACSRLASPQAQAPVQTCYPSRQRMQQHYQLPGPPEQNPISTERHSPAHDCQAECYHDRHEGIGIRHAAALAACCWRLIYNPRHLHRGTGFQTGELG